MRRTTIIVLVALMAVTAPAATGQPLEPPPEAIPGADYAVEPADTLGEGDVEVGMGAAGRAGSGASRTRRVRFSGDDLKGSVRQGSNDPLSGGALDGRAWLGAYTVGRLAPRWGRGLVLGAPGDPWEAQALDRGAGATFRGRAGEGISLRAGQRIEALYGRFGGHALGGARVGVRGVSAGFLTDRRGGRQGMLALLRGRGEAELAWDGAGRWRAEAMLERPLGAPRAGGERGWSAVGRVRGGAAGFASLAEAVRRGPARALAAGIAGPVGASQLRLFGATWRFRPGVTGTRAGLAIERPLAHHGALSFGFEEQRGRRRDAVATAALVAPDGMRQGVWGEWWSGEGALALGIRHESWGERAWARGVVRAVTSARIEARGPAGVQLGIIHSVYRVKRGESLYLREMESDRLVLRALSGDGDRTRIEARSPFSGGRMRAALNLTPGSERRARTQWTLDWTRRARIRSSPESRAR